MASLLLFTKSLNYPKAKTRLRSSNFFSDSFVTSLHNAFVMDTISLLENFKTHTSSIAWWPNISTKPEFSFARNFSQAGETFGERLQNAIQTCFTDSSKDLVVIGSDCPFITPSILAQAIATVESGSIALGPAQNNGFYLLGIPAKLSNVSIEDCFSDGNEIARVKEAYQAAKIVTLEELYDIDTDQDLKELRLSLNEEANTKEKDTKKKNTVDNQCPIGQNTKRVLLSHKKIKS